MKIKYLYNLAFILCAGLLFSCEKDEPEVQYTATYPVSGEWWVTNKVETSPGVFEDVYSLGHTPLLTSNTAANTANEIWISDEGNFWNYKIKAGVQIDNRTFSVLNAVNTTLDNEGEPYNIKVTITDGKVIEKGGLSRSKVQTDSIYFRATFEDDPGVIYHVSGHRRTGFLEDEF